MAACYFHNGIHGNYCFVVRLRSTWKSQRKIKSITVVCAAGITLGAGYLQRGTRLAGLIRKLIFGERTRDKG